MQDNLCLLKTNKKTKQKQNRFYKGKFISRTAVTYLVNCAGQSLTVLSTECALQTALLILFHFCRSC